LPLALSAEHWWKFVAYSAKKNAIQRVYKDIQHGKIREIHGGGYVGKRKEGEGDYEIQ